MKNQLRVFVFCIIAMLQAGCVSSTQFETASNTYIKEKKQCEQALNRQIKANQIEKQFLTEKIIKLEQALQQKENIISINETVIRLFDDSKRTLQNAIQDQLTKQKLDTPD